MRVGINGASAGAGIGSRHLLSPEVKHGLLHRIDYVVRV